MLSIKTTADDVRNIVHYLKTKATGATISEGKATLGNTLFDARKLTAYVTWDVVTRESDRLNLTPRGRDLSRASEERERQIFRDILRSQTPYRIALEWMFHQHFETVSQIDVAAHWHTHNSGDVGLNENSIRDQALCFFSIADAGGLGSYVVGRRGSATRFEPAFDALGQFIGETGLEDHSDAESGVEVDSEDLVESIPETSTEATVATTATAPNTPPVEQRLTPRVFITHSKNMEILDQVKTMLEMSDLDFEVAEDEETTAIPVPDKVFGAMRRCNSAVICVTADDQLRQEDGSYTINQNVLIEIGAAFVLYDKRVILVWDRRLTVPSNLQGLYRTEFEGNELSWSAGMKMMKGVNKFKEAV